jgi:hypothetical protein
VVRVALRDASQEQIDTMEQEITERAEQDAELAQQIADAAKRSGNNMEGVAGGAQADPLGKGADPNNQPVSGGRSTDPRATPPRTGAALKSDDVQTRRKPTTVVELRRQHRRMQP